MRRNLVRVLGLILLGTIACVSDGWAQWPKELEGIYRLHIAVQDLDPPAREVGLMKEDLERLASSILKGKLPDVTQEMWSEYVLVTVRLSKANGAPKGRDSYAASVTLRVYRPVVSLYKLRVLLRQAGLNLPTVVQSAILGAVWQRHALLTGDERQMAGLVKATLETQLQEFVADYYRANPAPPPPPEQQ
jgi:hypothetical protein